MNNPEKLAVYDTRDEDKQKHNMGQVWLHYAQVNTNNVNKTLALLQTTGGKEGPNIDSMRKSQRTPQNGTQNGKRHKNLKDKKHESRQYKIYTLKEFVFLFDITRQTSLLFF